MFLLLLFCRFYVWSSDANETHNPPSDLVMKGQRFFSGVNIKINLTNTDNQV